MNVLEYIKVDVSQGLTLQQCRNLAEIHPKKLQLLVSNREDYFMLMSTLNKVEFDIQAKEGTKLPLVKCPITNKTGIYDQAEYEANISKPNDIGDLMSCVALFHTVFNHPVGTKLSLLTPEQRNKRYKFMLEELDEFLQANTISDQFDALLDILYFLLGTLVEGGYSGELVEKGFLEVQRSNMTKLGQDGKPIFNEVGKIMKGPDYETPNLTELIDNELIK